MKFINWKNFRCLPLLSKEFLIFWADPCIHIILDIFEWREALLRKIISHHRNKWRKHLIAALPTILWPALTCAQTFSWNKIVKFRSFIFQYSTQTDRLFWVDFPCNHSIRFHQLPTGWRILSCVHKHLALAEKWMAALSQHKSIQDNTQALRIISVDRVFVSSYNGIQKTISLLCFRISQVDFRLLMSLSFLSHGMKAIGNCWLSNIWPPCKLFFCFSWIFIKQCLSPFSTCFGALSCLCVQHRNLILWSPASRRTQWPSAALLFRIYNIFPSQN